MATRFADLPGRERVLLCDAGFTGLPFTAQQISAALSDTNPIMIPFRGTYFITLTGVQKVFDYLVLHFADF